MKYDVAIIGAGISGMTLAIYLKRAAINFVLIEGKKPGGQINFASSVENFPGYIKISGREISQKVFEQVKALDVSYINDEVISVNKDDDSYILKMKNSSDVVANTLFIATGKKIKKLDIPHANDFLGIGLSYCATCDGMFFKDKDVLVVGDTNKALEESIYLSNICKKVIVLSENDEVRADSFYREKVSMVDNIEILYNSKLQELIKDDVLKEAIIIRGGQEERIFIDGCFAYVGYIPNSDLFSHLVDVNGDGYIIVDKNKQTSCKDIYAVGDVTDTKVYQLVTAMGDAAIAANSFIEKN